MNQASAKAVGIIVAIYCIILLFTYVIWGKDTITGLVIIASIISLIAGFVGFILMLPKESRSVGATVFISSALILLIGFGVCTNLNP